MIRSGLLFPGSVIAIALIVCFGGSGAYAQAVDVLGGNGDDDVTGILDPQEKVSQKDWNDRLAAALKVPHKAARAKELTELLDILLGQKDLVALPRERDRFADALMDSLPVEELRSRIASLIQPSANLQFDPAAQSRVNLGLRFAVKTGGASFEHLKRLLESYESQLDLDWLLPALGRTGGAQALPLIAKYRQDQVIIPVWNPQNIRKIPCAAVLAAAYAGDKEALEKILGWYEDDTVNRPTLAFQVAWAIGEGMKPDYSLVDFVNHRMRQAERLLDFLGDPFLKTLIERANRDLSVSLADYLMYRMGSSPPERLALFVPLLEHPCDAVRKRVLAQLLDRGPAPLPAEAMAKVRSFLTSPRGLDRLFAAEMLADYGSVTASKDITAAIAAETCEPVRERLRMLLPGGAAP